MKKLSEYENEEALDIFADILDPVTDIIGDPKIKEKVKGPKMDLIKFIVKNHKKSIIEILAVLDGVPVEEYKCNILTLPITIMELLNDKDLIDFFKSQGSMMETSSGSATENTEATETI